MRGSIPIGGIPNCQSSKQTHRRHSKDKAIYTIGIQKKGKRSSLPRGKASADEEKVELSTEPKSEKIKGKKDINFAGQKFRAPGGNRTCVDPKFP